MRRDDAHGHDDARAGAPALVLLPGMDGTSFLFHAVKDALGARAPVVTVAYPAHVELAYDELLPLVERALPRDRPYILVGESFSGPLACRLAARAPAGFVGLALVASFLRMPKSFPAFWRSVARERLFHLRPPRWVLKAALVGLDAPDALVDDVRAAVLAVKPRVLAARLHQVFDVDERATAGQVAAPVLYLGATRDRLLGRKARDDVKLARPDAEIVLVEGPHLVLQRRPHECARILVEFAARCGRIAEGAPDDAMPEVRPSTVVV